MSHNHVRPAQPPWLKVFVLVVGLLIMAIAGLMNISTHTHLGKRVPDWAGLTALVPIAVWLNALLSTVVWTASPEGSKARRTAYKAVWVGVGLSEAMNLGEHTWAYVDKHDGLGGGLIPILLVGSVPQLLDVISVGVIAEILSGDHGTTATAEATSEAPISEPADPISVPQQRPEPISDPPTLPNPKPLPELPPVPQQREPEGEQQPAPEILHLDELQAARQVVIDQIADMIREIRDAGDNPKKILTGPELIRRFPDLSYSDRHFLNYRKAAFEALDGKSLDTLEISA